MAGFDPTNPAHFALMQHTDGKLLHLGYSQEQIAEMRGVQAKLPPVRTVEELLAAQGKPVKQAAKAWGSDEPATAEPQSQKRTEAKP